MKNRTLAVGSILFLVLTGCGSSTTPSSSSGPKDVSSVPDATGPVVASSSSHMALQAATTGLKVSKVNDTSVVTWDSTKSGAMCEAARNTQQLLREAAQSDKIKCYMGVGESAGIFSVTYDNVAHFFQFNQGPGGPGVTPKIKYLMAKNSDGLLTTFKMWMCFNNSTQDEYVSAVRADDGTVTLTSVGVHSSSGNTGSQRTVATGKVNSSGQWVGTKTITHQGSGGTTGGSNDFSYSQNLTEVFTDTIATLSGYGVHSNTFQGQTFSGTSSFYSIIQLLNADKLSTLALGDGSVKINFTWGTNPANTGTLSWNGDTFTNLSDSTKGDYYTTVNAQTLPTAAVTTVQSFTGDEIWNCQAPTGETFATGDFSKFQTGAGKEGMDACNAKYFDDHNFTDCHQAAF